MEDLVRFILRDVRERREEVLLRWARELAGMPLVVETLGVIASEDLELQMERPTRHLIKVGHAGAVSMGHGGLCGRTEPCPADGRYRVVPVPLGAWDFLRKTSVVGLSQRGP